VVYADTYVESQIEYNQSSQLINKSEQLPYNANRDCKGEHSLETGARPP